MLSFIKKLFILLFGCKRRTIKYEVESTKVITTELVLASFIQILKGLLDVNAFNKSYKCVTDFILKDADQYDANELLTFVEISNVGPKELYESGIIAFAKKYSMLRCKCNSNEEFDSWINKVAAMIYEP